MNRLNNERIIHANSCKWEEIIESVSDGHKLVKHDIGYTFLILKTYTKHSVFMCKLIGSTYIDTLKREIARLL